MKLTNYVREDIRDKALKHKYGPVVTDLVARSAAIAVELYERLYSEADLLQMETLPEGWLPTDDEIDVNIGGQSHTFEFNGKIRIWGDVSRVTPEEVRSLPDVRKRFLAKHHDQRRQLSLPADDDLGQRASAIAQEWMDLATEIDDLKRKTMAALKTVTTAKRLVETWPEIAQFVDYEIKPPVPAIPIDTLNEQLGLRAA